MDVNFDAWFQFMERPDFEGQGLHITPGDPGGATNHGWTFTTWLGFCNLHHYHPNMRTMEYFGKMSVGQFYAPTRIAFWNGVSADHMPPGADVIWADFKFGSGWATAQLQQMLGVATDNVVGPKTLAALAEAYAANPTACLMHMTDVRKGYYKSLSAYSLFGRGWDRRADECEALAISLLSPAVPEPTPASAG